MHIPILPSPLTPTTSLHAKELSQQLNLPYTEHISEDTQYFLAVTETHVELHQQHSKSLPIYVDFLSPAATFRRLKGGGKGQLIARAVGIKKDFRPSVLDLTAGLGQDAFVLAALGCKVHMLERTPIIAALLADGLQRLHAHPEFNNFPLTLTVEDAKDYLLTNANPYDVLYLDPMFPERSKTALVKKEMRMLRDVVGEDLDAAVILELALQHAKKRVVVKRSRLAPTINEQKPDLVFTGQSSRFDVYFTNHAF